MLKKHYRPPDQLQINLKYRSKTLDNIKLPASLDVAKISPTENATQPAYEIPKFTRKIPPRTESLTSNYSKYSTNTSSGSYYSGTSDSIFRQSTKTLPIKKSRSKESLESSSTADTDQNNTLQCRRYCKKIIEKTPPKSTNKISRARSFKDYFKILKDKPMARESSYVAFEDQCPFDNFEKLSAKNQNFLTLPRSHKTSNSIRSKVKITRKNSDTFHNIDTSDRRSSGYTSNSSNECLSEFKPSLLSLPSSSLKSSKSSVTTDSEHSFSILKKGSGKYDNRTITSSSGGSIDDDDTKPIEFTLHYKNQFCTLTQTSTANLLSARTTPASAKKTYTKSPSITRAKSFNMDSRFKSAHTRSDSFNNFKYMKPKWV